LPSRHGAPLAGGLAAFVLALAADAALRRRIGQQALVDDRLAAVDAIPRFWRTRTSSISASVFSKASSEESASRLPRVARSRSSPSSESRERISLNSRVQRSAIRPLKWSICC